VTSIGDRAFENCTALTSVTLPINQFFTRILPRTFSGCTALDSITIPNSVTIIFERAFEGCTALESVTIPNSVTNIGAFTFRNTGLTNVIIPNSVTTIGERAFENCNALINVSIPYRVTSIGTGAFLNCTSLTSITVEADNPNFSSINGVLYNKAGSHLIQFPGGRSGSFTIPDSVTNIGYSAFAFTSLDSIDIPNTVTWISNNAFSNSTSLTSVIIRSAFPPSLGTGVFLNTHTTLRIFVPADSLTTYRTTTGWSSTSGIGIRHRIHRIGCGLPNPVSLTAVCPCP
jgi:hypothetical protein